jgi:hypothetical protein
MQPATCKPVMKLATGEQVYLDTETQRHFIEKDHRYPVQPTREEAAEIKRRLEAK